MRIAILTFHRAYNCGAILQAWALKTVLEEMGHVVEFPILNHVGETKRWTSGWRRWPRNPIGFLSSFARCIVYNIASIPGEDLLRFRFKRFRRRELLERNCEVRELSRLYDAVIVGSDQVWSSNHTGSYAPLFFGETLPKGIKRIAYSVSYGDVKKPLEELQQIIEATKKFDYISAREALVSDQLLEITQRKVAVTVDPTLLLDKKYYQRFVRNVKSEPYLFMYTLDTDPFFVESARALAKRLNVRVIIAPMYMRSKYGFFDGLTYGISPDRLISYIANAKYVVSHSFHGTAFSIIFNKPFLSFRLIEENPKYASRVGTLLRLTDCMDRLITPGISIETMLERLKAPMKVNLRKLSQARTESINWLADALK